MGVERTPSDSVRPSPKRGIMAKKWGSTQVSPRLHKARSTSRARRARPYPVIAAGWSIEPETGRNGPQFTFSLLGMNWLRINANIDGSYAILYGVTLRVINEWVWSR